MMDGQPPEVGSDRDAARTAAANAVSPDPVTAGLLAKHSAGEKLTPAEYGKLGAFKAKLSKWFGAGDAAAGPAGKPAPGNAAPVASLAPGEAPDDGLAPEGIDAGLVQRTTRSVLARLEAIARSKVNAAAREAHAPSEMVARLDRAASIPPDDRRLMIDLSPDVAASLGLNPRNYPVAVFCGCLGLWGADLALAVNELKQIAADRRKEEASKATERQKEKGERQKAEEADVPASTLNPS
jgi:hypothetical protein